MNIDSRKRNAYLRHGLHKRFSFVGGKNSKLIVFAKN